MDLKDIASVSGKPGLFKVLKPTRTGVILESLDVHKVKLIANANSKVSILKEISIYTTGKTTNMPLEDVLSIINTQFGNNLPLDPKTAENYELKDFLLTIVPDFDQEKVYVSDIKKLLVWYGIMQNFCPEVFELKQEEKVESASEEEKIDEPKVEKKPVKTKKQETGAAVNTKIKATKNTSVKNVTKNTPSKRGV